ncbi:PREDICTED: uncharacterized protein LOC109464295 [Branchiostoma belcheri]|uniref:Uncharacterized protein LOC109464295 n=1 Tax=Branchiostoma belcheri TaxID=7741 RepID=A0A6P4XXG6_BRABE|nr:PREDICTED: uncharacterized protein LOC109464295 [Branchiostoma belcheri]
MAASPSDGPANPRRGTYTCGRDTEPTPAATTCGRFALSTAEILLEDRNVDGGTAMSSPPYANDNKSGRIPLPSVKFTKMPPAHRPHRPGQSDGRRESGYDNLQKQAHQHVPLNPVYNASTDEETVPKNPRSGRTTGGDRPETAGTHHYTLRNSARRPAPSIPRTGRTTDRARPETAGTHHYTLRNSARRPAPSIPRTGRTTDRTRPETAGTHHYTLPNSARRPVPSIPRPARAHDGSLSDAPNEGRSIWERLRNHGQRVAMFIIIIIGSVVMVTLMVHVILVHTGSQPSHHNHPVTTNRGTGTTDSTAHAWQSSAVLRTVTSAYVILVDPARRRGPPDSVLAGVETSGPTQISRTLPVDTKEVSGGGSSISFDFESGAGKLQGANGVAVSADNKIWVADRPKACLQVYSMAGTYLHQFPKGAPGIGYPLNKTPVDVSIDRDGHLWVLMHGYPKSPDTVAQFTRKGHLKAKFDLPDTVPRGANRGMAVGLRNNHVFVTWSDGYNGGVQAFQPNGKLLWDGQRRMQRPMYVAVNEEGNVFVSDYNTHYIYMYDAAGQYVLRFGGPGLSGSDLNYPRGICVDKSGHIVVADSDNQRVVVYTSRGDYVRHIAIRALHLRDVAVGPGGQLVVLNFNKITVLPFYL